MSEEEDIILSELSDDELVLQVLVHTPAVVQLLEELARHGVGHNPGLSDLVTMLTKRSTIMAPGMLTRLRMPTDWTSLTAGSATLKGDTKTTRESDIHENMQSGFPVHRFRRLRIPRYGTHHIKDIRSCLVRKPHQTARQRTKRFINVRLIWVELVWLQSDHRGDVFGDTHIKLRHQSLGYSLLRNLNCSKNDDITRETTTSVPTQFTTVGDGNIVIEVSTKRSHLLLPRILRSRNLGENPNLGLDIPHSILFHLVCGKFCQNWANP